MGIVRCTVMAAMIFGWSLALCGCNALDQNAPSDASAPVGIPVMPSTTPMLEEPARAAAGAQFASQFALAQDVRSLPTSDVNQDCNVDSVNGQVAKEAALDRTGSATFSGWVANVRARKVPATLWLVLKGAQDYYAQGTTGISRPDVAAANDIPVFATSGYRFSAYLAGVPVGEYQIALTYRIDGTQIQCDTKVTVRVE